MIAQKQTREQIRLDLPVARLKKLIGVPDKFNLEEISWDRLNTKITTISLVFNNEVKETVSYD